MENKLCASEAFPQLKQLLKQGDRRKEGERIYRGKNRNLMYEIPLRKKVEKKHQAKAGGGHAE